jgi:hypothetical protein
MTARRNDVASEWATREKGAVENVLRRLTIALSASDSKARLYKRQDDGTLTTLATAGSALSLTSGLEYEAKVVTRP